MDSRYTLENVLATLNTVNVLRYGEQNGLSEIAKGVRTILGLFGVEVPKEPLFDREVMDLMNLMKPVPVGNPPTLKVGLRFRFTTNTEQTDGDMGGLI